MFASLMPVANFCRVQISQLLHGNLAEHVPCVHAAEQTVQEMTTSGVPNCHVQALEGLPGADGLEAYEFVSRRTGGWDDERRRLQKEGDKRSRLASRVGM
jgi:hypothetical protein